MSSWQRQTKDFGHSQNTNSYQSPKYQNLVYDIRGMGKSDKPLFKYSTSEMAKDAIELVDMMGWTSERQLHVIGVSMGGMIAQELVRRFTNCNGIMVTIVKGSFNPREDSISVICLHGSTNIQYSRLFRKPQTEARSLVRLSPCANGESQLTCLSRLPKSTDVKLANIKARMFSPEWLVEPDAEGHFPTNGDRFAAQEIQKKEDPLAFTTKGFILQIIAAGWHHKSSAQIAEMGDKVGRERIQVIHGTVDKMITVPHGELLAKELGGEEKGVTVIFVEGKGHGLPMEWRKGFTKAIAALVEKAEAVPRH